MTESKEVLLVPEDGTVTPDVEEVLLLGGLTLHSYPSACHLLDDPDRVRRAFAVLVGVHCPWVRPEPNMQALLARYGGSGEEREHGAALIRRLREHEVIPERRLFAYCSIMDTWPIVRDLDPGHRLTVEDVLLHTLPQRLKEQTAGGSP